MVDKSRGHKPQKCNHIVKRIYKFNIAGLPRGVAYFIIECVDKTCGQVVMRKMEPKKGVENG